MEQKDHPGQVVRGARRPSMQDAWRVARLFPYLVALGACSDRAPADLMASGPSTTSHGTSGVESRPPRPAVGMEGAVAMPSTPATENDPQMHAPERGAMADTDPAEEPEAWAPEPAEAETSKDQEPAWDGTTGLDVPDAAFADATTKGEGMQVTCPDGVFSPGEHTERLRHDGELRSFLIYVPRTYDNTRALPLVINFHGGFQNSAHERDFSRMNPMADEKGFVVVYPQGTSNAWDAGACCTRNEVDDVGFTRAIVEFMKARTCIDARRIYATGMSNGGRMSYRLGCEAADVFAAIAPVAGIKSFPDLDNSPGCMPSRPISLIDFQGTADTRHIEYQSGQIAEWVAFNRCTDAQPEETYRKGEHYCKTYSQCEEGTSVTYCVVQGGGHCWPGSYPCGLGDTSRPEELSANELMWELFERSTL